MWRQNTFCYVQLTIPCAKPSKPSCTASIWWPCRSPILTAERTAAFIPAHGAPTFRMAMLILLWQQQIYREIQYFPLTQKRIMWASGTVFRHLCIRGMYVSQHFVSVPVVLKTPIGKNKQKYVENSTQHSSLADGACLTFPWASLHRRISLHPWLWWRLSSDVKENQKNTKTSECLEENEENVPIPSSYSTRVMLVQIILH